MCTEKKSAGATSTKTQALCSCVATPATINTVASQYVERYTEIQLLIYTNRYIGS